MLNSSSKLENLKNLNEGEIYDPISNQAFSFKDGSLCVRPVNSQDETRYQLPDFSATDVTNFTYLKFKRSNQSNIIVSPSGQALTCKS